MEARPGTYALILRASTRQRLFVGQLGPLQVSFGIYIYVGSAFGPGGLAARVARHQRQTQVRHWHIDYLRPLTQPEAVWYTYDQLRREHQWAGLFQVLPGAVVPLPGFGSSDCQCDAHLFYFRTLPAFATFRKHAYAEAPGAYPIYRLGREQG